MADIKKLTGEEIIEWLTENFETYEFEELGYSKHEVLGNVEIVDDVEETSGDAWRVAYFKDHDVYVRHNGYYCSYESYAQYEDHDYDVVEPYQAVVTFYESAEEKEERAK